MVIYHQPMFWRYRMFCKCVFNLITHNLCKQWITNVRWLFSVICLMITRSQGFCTTLQGQHGDGVTVVSSSNFCGCVLLDIQSHKQYIYICIYIYGWYINIYGCFNQQYMVYIYIPSFHGSFDSFEWGFHDDSPMMHEKTTNKITLW